MSRSQKMDLSERLFFAVMCFALAIMVAAIIFFPFLFVDLMTIEEIGIKKVDCYDRYTNVIIGVQCEEETYCTMWGLMNGQKCSEVKP
ncbi:hypothetical protein LCGC14_3083280 [marine sediment metagenome]|uniref:Uncharacterized protein n=1 Tax=marine sediment metagenome TaxID=412755 RepID=A0A0F8WCK7_9ZZZZ